MAITNSPNMNLPIPVVGSEAGPQYAIDIDSCLNILDGHDHTAGNGVQITPSALNINSDLLFNSNNATLLRSTRYVPQGSPINGTTDLNCLSVSGVDLYYRDGSGNIVRITQSGGVAGSPGSIANLTGPASASYVALDATFVWQSAALTSANMDFASAIFRNDTASSFGVTVQPPTLSSDYSLTLPNVPGATSFLTIDATGIIAPTIAIAQGITESMMANNSVSGTSGSFATTSTSRVDVTNLNVTITTSGRPVLVVLSAVSAGGYIQTDSSVNPFDGFIAIQRNGVDNQINRIGNSIVGSEVIIPANMSFLDIIGAGTYTYKVQANVVSNTNTLTIQNCRIVAIEL